MRVKRWGANLRPWAAVAGTSWEGLGQGRLCPAACPRVGAGPSLIQHTQKYPHAAGGLLHCAISLFTSYHKASYIKTCR